MPNDIASALETAGPRILDTAQLLKCYAGNEHSLPRLELPNFQRDYVWGPDQWGQLWEDLVELSDENGQHFMGSHAAEDRKNFSGSGRSATADHRYSAAGLSGSPCRGTVMQPGKTVCKC